MQRKREHSHGLALGALVSTGVLAGGLVCGAGMSAASGAPHAAKAKVIVVMAAKRAKFGSILVTTKGMTLYTYGKDKKNHSTVTGAVLAAWPALVVPAGKIPVGKGVGGIGEFRRQGGKEQVTDRGAPLYTFVGDNKPGQVTGQGVDHFAVVRLSAAAPTMASSTSTSSAGTSSSTAPAGSGIPQNNGGDSDADNNGAPSAGDGNF